MGREHLAPSPPPASLSRWLDMGVRAVQTSLFGSFCCHGSGQRRSLALTFDDGPSPGTLQVLHLLRKYRIQATFFVCGSNVQRHPEIARAICGDGHELGNHTFSHRRLCPRLGWKLNLLGPAEIVREFASAQRCIAEVTGVQPCVMRPPYGMRWWGIRAAGRQLGLRGVLWSAIAHDWEWSSSEVAVHTLRESLPGAILCFHDGRDTNPYPDVAVTVRALERILPALCSRGFAFETVSQLLRSDEEAARAAHAALRTPSCAEAPVANAG